MQELTGKNLRESTYEKDSTSKSTPAAKYQLRAYVEKSLQYLRA